MDGDAPAVLAEVERLDRAGVLNDSGEHCDSNGSRMSSVQYFAHKVESTTLCRTGWAEITPRSDDESMLVAHHECN